MFWKFEFSKCRQCSCLHLTPLVLPYLWAADSPSLSLTFAGLNICSMFYIWQECALFFVSCIFRATLFSFSFPFHFFAKETTMFLGSRQLSKHCTQTQCFHPLQQTGRTRKTIDFWPIAICKPMDQCTFHLFLHGGNPHPHPLDFGSLQLNSCLVLRPSSKWAWTFRIFSSWIMPWP